MSEESFIGIFIVVLLAAGAAIGAAIAYPDGKEHVQKEAIQHGYGTYQDGKFTWIIK